MVRSVARSAGRRSNRVSAIHRSTARHVPYFSGTGFRLIRDLSQAKTPAGSFIMSQPRSCLFRKNSTRLFAAGGLLLCALTWLPGQTVVAPPRNGRTSISINGVVVDPVARLGAHTIAFHRLANGNGNRPCEHGAGVTEGVEFTRLGAGIDVCR